MLAMVNGSQGFAVMRPGRISFFFPKIQRNFSSLMSLSAIVQIPTGFDTKKIDLVEIGVYMAYNVEKCLQSKNNN
jgi:hypothetical protein